MDKKQWNKPSVRELPISITLNQFPDPENPLIPNLS